MKKIKILFGFFIAITLFSCSKDESIDQSISASDVTINSKIDSANDDVTVIVVSEERAT